MSLGTVGVIRVIRGALALSLREAKSIVDDCVFRNEEALLHLPTKEAATALRSELLRLEGPTLEVEIHQPSECPLSSVAGPALRALPEVADFADAAHTLVPDASDAALYRLGLALGRILYAPRYYVRCYRDGHILAAELRDVLLAHTHTSLCQTLDRTIALSVMDSLARPYELLLFGRPL